MAETVGFGGSGLTVTIQPVALDRFARRAAVVCSDKRRATTSRVVEIIRRPTSNDRVAGRSVALGRGGTSVDEHDDPTYDCELCEDPLTRFTHRHLAQEKKRYETFRATEGWRVIHD